MAVPDRPNKNERLAGALLTQNYAFIYRSFTLSKHDSSLFLFHSNLMFFGLNPFRPPNIKKVNCAFVNGQSDREHESNWDPILFSHHQNLSVFSQKNLKKNLE